MWETVTITDWLNRFAYITKFILVKKYQIQCNNYDKAEKRETSNFTQLN